MLANKALDADARDDVAMKVLAAARAAMAARGFVLKDKEHLVNFRAFEAAFGRDGERLPTRRRLGLGEGCAGCCFDIGDSMFCEVCGAYPAARQQGLTSSSGSGPGA